jgi:hypothetical protein
MKIDGRGLALLGVLSVLGGQAMAQSADVKWKLYGSSVTAGDETVFFYNGSDVRREGAHFKVWTKGVLLKVITGARVADKNNPPSGQDLEVWANTNTDKTTMMIFNEVDCLQKQLKQISISGIWNGQTGMDNTPGPWIPIPPQTAADVLWQLVCQKK